jgi:hypothetical protein
MDKNFILQKFYMLSPNIVNKFYLEKYVDFCLDKRVEEKILRKTTSHHILPCAKTLPFKDWSDLNVNSWNKAELLYSDHYKAHYLLMRAIDHIATYHAFAAMHKKDFAIGRLLESDLIPSEEFDEIWDERNRKVSKRRLEIITVDGKEITRAKYYNDNRILSQEVLDKMSKRVLGENNPVKQKWVVDKIRDKKQNTYIDGKNLDTISAERAAKTMHQEFLDENGNCTTIYKENGKKLSKTLLSIEDNGKTKAYNKNKKLHENLRRKGKWYKVLNIFDDTYEEILAAADVRKISPGLESCSRDNYLGKSKFGFSILNKRNKSHLIGLYCEKIE